MPSEIIINTTSRETRIALLENGILVELQIERESDKGIAGNIYKGRVQRVLPGMQAAFVDIGLPRAAFLYIDDVYNIEREIRTMLSVFKDEGDDTDVDQIEVGRREYACPPPIADLLTDGQELLVQIMKEPIGSKGARISSHISLPGRYLVFLPTFQNIGISRRIDDEDERQRLKEIIERIRPAEGGFIIRTASEGATEEDLASDRDFLLKLWQTIQRKMDHAPVPSMLHADLSIALRAVRDLYSKHVRRVVVDSPDVYRNILAFIETFMPQLKPSVETYQGEEPIFEAYGIDIEISRALEKRTWLKSGGYIVIEETEALVVIDVNTGRYVGKANQEDTILKTNLEATKEIAYQIRLRNLGGIIIIDFIDMERKGDREMVLHSLTEALKKDRVKTTVFDMSELGLVQMTRKRMRANLRSQLCQSCPHCEGTAVIRSIPSISYDVLRALRKGARETASEQLMVQAHPDVVAFIYDEEHTAIEELEHRSHKKIIIQASPDMHYEKFSVSSR